MNAAQPGSGLETMLGADRTRVRHPGVPLMQPPGRRPQPTRTSGAAGRRLWLALGATLALAVLVVVLLPALVAPQHTDPAPAATADATLDATSNDQRGAAEDLLRDYLRLRARLELAGAARWGEPQWSDAAQAAADGDRLWAQRRYAAGTRRYQAALRDLGALERSRSQRFAQALEAGRAALGEDRGADARDQFELALAIEPGQVEARRLLARAEVRGQVMEALQSGAAAERSGDDQGARAAYRAALALDAQHELAVDGLARVERRIQARDFRLAMSEALVALEAGRLGKARQALAAAAAAKPDDPALVDARQRLAAASQGARLQRLRARAAEQVEHEDWDAALRTYREALALEADAGFARNGATQSAARSQLHARLDDFLVDSSRLWSPEPLAAAERLLQSVGDVGPGEPRLAHKVAALQERVQQAATPLPVVLRSDGNTEVTIYHVGSLGRFEQQRLELRPGTYTAVGTRSGYRDVRRVFTVRPGQAPQSLELSCEERV